MVKVRLGGNEHEGTAAEIIPMTIEYDLIQRGRLLQKDSRYFCNDQIRPQWQWTKVAGGRKCADTKVKATTSDASKRKPGRSRSDKNKSVAPKHKPTGPKATKRKTKASKRKPAHPKANKSKSEVAVLPTAIKIEIKEDMELPPRRRSERLLAKASKFLCKTEEYQGKAEGTTKRKRKRTQLNPGTCKTRGTKPKRGLPRSSKSKSLAAKVPKSRKTEEKENRELKKQRSQSLPLRILETFLPTDFQFFGQTFECEEASKGATGRKRKAIPSKASKSKDSDAPKRKRGRPKSIKSTETTVEKPKSRKRVKKEVKELPELKLDQMPPVADLKPINPMQTWWGYRLENLKQEIDDVYDEVSTIKIEGDDEDEANIPFTIKVEKFEN